MQFLRPTLHALDLWAKRWRQREASGDMIIVRHADDVVAGFEREDDARRFLDAMRARLEEFELTLHTAKTRLIEFGRHAAAQRKQRGLGTGWVISTCQHDNEVANCGFPLGSPWSPHCLPRDSGGRRAGGRPQS